MKTRKNQILSLLLAGLTLMVGTNLSWGADQKVPVVVSFSILADIVQNVGGDHIHITTLVGPDQDSHAYQPKPSDSKALKQAKLVIMNGLGFERWMNRLVVSSGYKGRVVKVAEKGIKVRHFKAASSHGHAHSTIDPHAWQSISNVIEYVNHIEAALIQVDPSHAQNYRRNAAVYKTKLGALDQKLLRLFADLPVSKRRIVTSHEAFGYFGDRYKLSILSLQGLNPDAELSAAEIARVIQQVKQQQIRALFLESTANRRLMETVSKETGVTIGGKLYSDALSATKSGPATYLDLMSQNAQTILAALMP